MNADDRPRAPVHALRRLVCAGAVLLASTAHPTQARAEWQPNGTMVVPWNGEEPTLLGDGAGGAFLVWTDPARLRFTHVGADGSVPPGLPGGGALVYPNWPDGPQYHPSLHTDGAGGMYVVWADKRWADCPFGCTAFPLEIYVLRLLADGTPAPGWPVGGINVGAPPLPWLLAPQACSDGAGGVIVTWSEPATGDTGNIKARRFGPDGTSTWGDTPTTVCSAASGQFAPRLAPDGAGGVVIVWQDERTALGGLRLYAQRISGAGVAQWALNGISLGTTQGLVAGPAQLVPAPAGGMYVAWGEAGDWAYLGHLTASGGRDWSFEIGASDAMADLRIAGDGVGGVFATWSLVQDDIHLLRVGPDGVPPPGWTGPELVCDAPGAQSAPHLALDDVGGVYVLWRDDRSGGQELYATHLDPSGTPASGWPANGRLICSAPESRMVRSLARDGTGGAIALWEDLRDGPTYALYAQRLVPTGILAAPEPGATTFALTAPRPNPARGTLVAAFELPDAAPAQLELLDIAGRRVECREVGSLGAGRHTITFRAGAVAPGVYVLRLARADGMRTQRVAILPGSR